MILFVHDNRWIRDIRMTKHSLFSWGATVAESPDRSKEMHISKLRHHSGSK